MSVPVQWYGLAVVTTLLNGTALGLIAWRERSDALRRWAIAWFSWGLAVVPLSMLGSPERHPLLAVACGLLWVVSTLHFLLGVHGLAHRAMPRAWYAVAAACAVLALSLGVGPGGALGMVPLVLFQSAGLASAGVTAIRRARARAGAWIAGVALIGLGAHVLDAPWLAQHGELFLWGFVLAIALQVLAAFGMLVLHYEHARAELIEAQRALEEKRRIEALGLVAGGVAHDFNNLLTVMQGHVALLRMDGEAVPALQPSLGAIDEAIARAARLTRQLLAFGRRSVLNPQPVDVREVVASTIEFLRKVIPENITLELDCPDSSLAATLDRALLEQIILNLVTNARDAISGHGRIRVELASHGGTDAELVLRVIDSGEGMDEARLKRIFEPFFTSKGGRGTGLGLASVHGAVTQLGGRIGVESTPGHGSRFEVVLPWQRPASLASRRVSPPSEPGRKLRILVVEDDPSVRRVTSEMLAIAGHDTEQVGDGLEALERLRARAFDLVVSDVVMPRMGGVELSERLTHLPSPPAILLTSGFPDAAASSLPQAAFLAKPFSHEELRAAVARTARSSDPLA